MDYTENELIKILDTLEDQKITFSNEYKLNLNLSEYFKYIDIKWEYNANAAIQKPDLLVILSDNNVFFDVKAIISIKNSMYEKVLTYKFKKKNRAKSTNSVSSASQPAPLSPTFTSHPTPNHRPSSNHKVNHPKQLNNSANNSNSGADLTKLNFYIEFVKNSKIFKSLDILRDSIIVGKLSSRHPTPDVDLKKMFDNESNEKRCSRKQLTIVQTKFEIVVKNIGNKSVYIEGKEFTPGLSFNWNENRSKILIGDEITLKLKEK